MSALLYLSVLFLSVLAVHASHGSQGAENTKPRSKRPYATEYDERVVRETAIHQETAVSCKPPRSFFVSSFDCDALQNEKEPPLRFPYMCSLRKRGSWAHVCAAALFRRDWVVTAAHCVDKRIPGSVGLSPIVYCGIHQLDESDNGKVSRGGCAL